MKKLLVSFLREEQGQDLVEYTLLLAFVCLASAVTWQWRSIRAIYPV